MSEEKIKTTRLKRFMVIILAIFTFLVIIHTDSLADSGKSSDPSINITAINGKNWTVTNSSDDYTLAEVVKATYELNEEKIKNQSKPSGVLEPGHYIGTTCGDNQNTPSSFNWCATIGTVQRGYVNQKWCQMVCVEPTKSLNTVSGKSLVQRVLFVSKDKLTVYYKNPSNGNIESEDCNTSNSVGKSFDKVLQEAYNVQKGKTVEERLDAAWHVRMHLADQDYNTKLNTLLDNWDLYATEIGNPSCTYKEDEDYDYYGVFVFVGTASKGSQGRIIFKVIQVPKIKETNTKFLIYKKGLESNNSIKNAVFRVVLNKNIKSVKITGGYTIESSKLKYDNKYYKITYDKEKKTTNYDEIDNEPKDLETGDNVYAYKDSSNGRIRIFGLKTNSSGLIQLTKITFDNNTIPRIWINETKAATGYNKTAGMLRFDYKNNQWEESTADSDMEKDYYKYEDGDNSVTIYNSVEPITDLTILKKELGTENSLNDAVFEVYFNRVSKIKLSSSYSEIDVKNVLEDKKLFKLNENGKEVKLYYKLNTKGKIDNNVEPETTPPNDNGIWIAKNSEYPNSLFIHGLKTNGGKITISKIYPTSKGIEEGTIFTIVEWLPPSGYEKIDGKIQFYCKFKSGEWELSERTDNGENIATGYWNISKDKKTVVTVYNSIKPIEGININKKEINISGKKTETQIKDVIFEVYFNRISSIQFGDMKNAKSIGDILGGIKTNDGSKYYKLDNNFKAIATKVYTKDEALADTKNNIYVSFYDENGENNIKILGLKTKANENIKISKIVPTSSGIKNGVIVTIYEAKTPATHKSLNGNLYMYCKWNKDKGKWCLETRGETPNGASNLDKKYYSIKQDSVDITIYNDINTIIDQFKIVKTDSQNTKTNVIGAEFKITPTNIKIGGKTNAVTTTTTKEGLILDKLEMTKSEATLTITETKAPEGYKKLEGDIKITLQLTSNGIVIKNVTKSNTISDSEFNVKTGANIDGRKITLNIQDIPVITLSGQVWLDGQLGEKGNVQGANGEKNDTEKRLAGVKVYLYNADAKGNKSGNAVKETTTDANGNYSFKDIIKTANGYKIEFEYNGITYQETGSYNGANKGKDSDASENVEERNGFNGRFKTIDKNMSNDETPLSYNYNEENETSTLKSEIDGTNPRTGNKDFAIKAYTATYKETTKDIDCGLIEKSVDLSIGTDVDSAKVKINSKETTYNYKQIIDGELENLNLQNKSSSQGANYNLKLYKSDYNYRIDDYSISKDGVTENKVNPNSAGFSIEGTPGNESTDATQELQVTVNYKVVLMNQTRDQGAIVDEFVYYYDDKYEFLDNEFKSEQYKLKEHEGNMLIFEKTNNNSNMGERQYVDLTFRVRKGDNGLMLGEFKNITEITKYTTERGGLIDKDSAPNNGIWDRRITQYEDDTDESPGINISIDEALTRTIKGNVFEDTGTGTKGSIDDTDPKVEDVIVQLIEIKKISGAYFEYIWQETRSGSNTVKKLSREDGTKVEETTYNNKEGEYLFTDFIPGNYIIRYIYGDGSTYNITDNVKKYNGQDYKSTIDDHYNVEWYNNAGYGDKSNMARDNEARRLQVMAYSTKIDAGKAEEINKKDAMLNETWMCAETSKINIPVDTEDKSTTSNETTVDGKKDTPKNEFTNINFGLMERPKIKLALEKHITGLKITPAGVGVQPIVDAKADIKDIMNLSGSLQNIVTGITSELSTDISTRANRGFWKVETDIEELIQGATLEVTYTYVIKNESDEDYLDKKLVDEFKNYEIDEYNKFLNNNAKMDTRGKTHKYGEYLGEYYYTGKPGTGDTEVSSRADKIEEALNNDLKFSEETSGSDFKKSNQDTVKKPTYTTNGIKQDSDIETVIQSTAKGDNLIKGTTDTNKKVTLTNKLSSANKEINLPSYIAEIVEYESASGGRIDEDYIPGNLSYVHSEDTGMVLDSYVKYADDGSQNVTDVASTLVDGYVKLNGQDEFWGEKIIVTKPTGEDKITPVQITIITVASIAVLGIGIILVKKYALKK